MFKHVNAVPRQCQGMTGVERLSLRVSSMINHPLAQTQRWVVVHRLDTDGDAEWDEVMGLLLETPELNLTFTDDQSVTVRWARTSVQARDDFSVEQYNEEVMEEAPPF
ncbi:MULTISPECIES: DUF1654 domain-containing protein [unclassified Pseudomonas]|jgi:hypothetical protein|uniref:DUF1654 domain-containing protein n=1 Tax=unclassified Pseudomonas TaxID=196821 RepID=UPI000C88421E|nr:MULTISPECIES: DUF1654 domain-containing protein [unclassified Pseudomonas]PNB00133.1 hypothetical protein C1X74_06560 [Pseudomonas sp. GW460-5]PNB57999.1 hypothetical protein C1X73_15160 [Pseudomonas sp. FW305-130]